MRVLLYRPSLDLNSGAGQLLAIQQRGLKAAGVAATLACERGALKFFLRTGIPVKRCTAAAVRSLQRERGCLVIDHGACIPTADVVFVHNLQAEANRHLQRADLAESVRAEHALFRDLRPSTLVVANSRLVQAALLEHFALPAEQVVVQHPGVRAAVFSPPRLAALRARARRTLGVDARAPLVGFVTSGDFQKRGLDLFLDSAERIGAVRADARFLVVGSKRLPEWAHRHPLVADGRVAYRPKSRHPEAWFAALDLFLYTARFEEFGMVVAEAQAAGIPIVTSRLVGASECLPSVYEPWLLERPEPARLAERSLALLADAQLRSGLARAGIESAAAVDQRAYIRATVAMIIDAQNRRLR
jgi:glycosyltransferase involved in cell wall biosynthesis